MALDLLAQILPHVKSHIHPASISLPEWKLKEGDVSDAASPRLNDTQWKNYTIPAPWGGYDRTVWFRKRIAVPAEFTGKQVVLLLDLPEALLYVNGKPYQGIDQHHQEVLLTPKARGNQQFLLALEAYSGRVREQRTFASAALAVLNPTARALYVCLCGLRDLDKFFGATTPESKEIRELIRQTLIFLKYFKPEGEEYPNAIARAYNFLLRTLEGNYKSDIPGMLHLVAQSHIDVVWLWRTTEARRKCARTFSTALRLMEEYPEFSFTQSQAQLYEFVREDHPEILREIKARAAEGRWHVAGSTWVEPDCNIPNGESLVRQIHYGKRYFRREFGLETDILWLPDTFGYSWSLPQIMYRSGIRYFFTTKLTWNDTNKFPHNTFWWEGIDGSRILTHVPPVGLEGNLAPKDLRKGWEGFQEKEQCPHVLQTFGYGDGGGGPTTEQIEQARMFRTLIGLPPSKLSNAAEFFRQIEQSAGELPRWRDELYLEKHRGTYTTHGWVKRENRQAESLLYTAELLSVLGMLYGRTTASRRYPQKELETSWKLLLLNQFHDIVPGTAIAEAYEDVRRDFNAIRTACLNIQQQVLEGLTERDRSRARVQSVSIFNTLGWERNDYVVIEIKAKEKEFAIVDDEGLSVKHQVIERRRGSAAILCFVENIPPFSFKRLTISPAPGSRLPTPPWKSTPRTLETPFYRVRLDSKGQLSSLYDKSLRRELLARGARGNKFQTFRDIPRQWEAWDIDADYLNKEVDLLQFKGLRVVETGPLRAVLRAEFHSSNGSKLTQLITFYHASRRIDFRTKAVWREKQTLLKVAFPLNVKTRAATYEIQFGALQRSTKHSDPVQKAKFEVPAQQWADLSETRFGVGLLNDCKYGYDAKDSTVRLTLIRSPHFPHPVEPWKYNDERFTDQGEHRFTYSLLPHAGDWRTGEVVQRARELNNPLLVVHGTAIAARAPFVTVSGKNVIIDSIKKAEDHNEIVIRAHEAYGQTTKTTFEFGVRIDQALECDLLENEIGKLKVTKSRLTVRFAPFEIKTFRLKARPVKASNRMRPEKGR